VKVNKVSEPELPEIDEKFIKAFGVEDGTMESLRAEIRSNMERELTQKLRTMNKERVMDALLEANKPIIPKAMIQDEAKRMKENTQRDMAQSGQATNFDIPTSVFEPQAERRVALGLLVGKLIDEQNVQADADRVRAMVEEFTQSYENPQEVVDYYMGNKEQLAPIENLVVEEQVVEWVLEQANVEEEQASFADLMGAGEQ
jgi:trigger factor